MSANRDSRDAGERPADETQERTAKENEEETGSEAPPDTLPYEKRSLAAGKDSRRPPREEDVPRTPGNPPHAPRPRDRIGGRSGSNR